MVPAGQVELERLIAKRAEELKGFPLADALRVASAVPMLRAVSTAELVVESDVGGKTSCTLRRFAATTVPLEPPVA